MNREDVCGEQVWVLLQNSEAAINGGVDPKEAAQLFLQHEPENAVKLATEFKSEEAVQFLEEWAKTWPAVSGSPILRRDGKKWMAGLFSQIRAAGKTA